MWMKDSIIKILETLVACFQGVPLDVGVMQSAFEVVGTKTAF